MKKLVCMVLALGLTCSVLAQNADMRQVVSTVTVVDNDSLRIDCTVVADSGPLGDLGYRKDWFSFYNKTDRTLIVCYHVDATLTRYNRSYSYDYTLSLEPRASRGDNVMMHYPVENFYVSPRYDESDLKATLRLLESDK